MSVRVSCPFCNTSFTLAEVPPTRKAPCPRCGEAVPVKPTGGEPDAPPAALANGPLSGPYPPTIPAPNVAGPLFPLALIGGGLAVLAVAAAAAGYLMRPTPPPATPPAIAKPPSTWPPAAVQGLAYLPAEANAAAAVQFRAVGAFAERTGSTPRAVLASAGVPTKVLDTLDRIGLPPEQVDHAVLGLVVAADNPIPRAVLVLALPAAPADEAAFLKGLKAERHPDAAGRYKVDLGGLPVEMAKASDAVFVFATYPKDLAGLAEKHGRGSGHLAGLREPLARLSPSSVAWAVAGAADWAEMPAVKLLAGLAKQTDAAKPLDGVRAAAVGVSLEPDPRLGAAVRGDRAVLQPRLAELLGDAAAVGADGDWVTADRPLDIKPGK